MAPRLLGAPSPPTVLGRRRPTLLRSRLSLEPATLEFAMEVDASQRVSGVRLALT
jgi:hypothetical protein